MNTFAQIMTLLSALIYLGVAPLELFFYERPAVQKFLHVEADNVADVRMWAFVIGFRNMLGGIAAVVGLVMLWNGSDVAGRAVALTALSYMVLASLAMGVADLLGYWRPRGGSVMGVIGSTVPPLIALIAAVA